MRNQPASVGNDSMVEITYRITLPRTAPSWRERYQEASRVEEDVESIRATVDREQSCRRRDCCRRPTAS
jgi:hypothetical protein